MSISFWTNFTPEHVIFVSVSLLGGENVATCHIYEMFQKCVDVREVRKERERGRERCRLSCSISLPNSPDATACWTVAEREWGHHSAELEEEKAIETAQALKGGPKGRNKGASMEQ